MLKLQELESIPEGLLELEKVSDLHTVLPQPTLIHLKGEKQQALFVSVLLHANEDTGFFAIQTLLKRYQNKLLPRSLCIFFGNIEASKKGVRHLDGQPDYNRVWPGTDYPECEETRLMQDVVNSVSTRNLFASIDIHNNTGKNPHYGCVNKLEPNSLYLSSLFSRIVVFFETPKGVQTMAMSEFCPSVTLECGKPHLAHGVEHATDFVETVLHMETLEPHANHKPDIEIYHTVARVTIPESNSFAFSNDTNDSDSNTENNKTDDSNSDIIFAHNIDRINFTQLPANTVFGKIRPDSNARLIAWDDHEKDVTDDFFTIDGENLTLSKSLMPAMLTLDKKIVRQDCLCYLMENINV